MMIQEIEQIPKAAALCRRFNQSIELPKNVPYLGMGSSYFAALALKHQGINIRPEQASEYFHYIHPPTKQPMGVLISQSGKSSEVLWCRELFERKIVVVNDETSPLALSAPPQDRILMKAGEEQFTSSKTYINTLIALYCGHNIDSSPSIDVLEKSMNKYEHWGRDAAEVILRQIEQGQLNGIYVLGSGPNVATAKMGALGIQESAKLAASGLTTAQFDHGPKEAAKNAVVISAEAKGPSCDRALAVLKKVRNAGATTLEICENDLPEHLTPITHVIPLFYLMHFLIAGLNIKDIFAIGGKITEAHK